MKRRDFLKTSATGICAAGIIPAGITNKTETRQKIESFRTLGRTGFKVSEIGFGAGFLNDPSVLNRALEIGINYIDTGEHYGNGQSEATIGEVIGRHDRKKIFITTKLNLSFGEEPTKDRLKSRFTKCLERMKTDYADCLMIHMTPDIIQVKHEDFHEAFKELKSDGKVRFLGLSNHGTEQSIYGFTPVKMEDVILAAAEDGRFDVALFVYNFLQKEQGEKIISKCKEKNIGVTLMKTNPVLVYERRMESIEQARQRGRDASESLQKMMDEYKNRLAEADEFKKKHGIKTNEEIRDAAIRFTLSNPDVHTVCPTIQNFDELNAFAALAGTKLSDIDESSLDNYSTNLGKYYCRHACGECEPACPKRVPINTIMRYNHYFDSQQREKQAMSKYAKLTFNNASECFDCDGVCERNCRHNVPVRAMMMYAHQNLSLG